MVRTLHRRELRNTDGDATKTSLTTFTSPDAFEIVDLWGNPVVYIHQRDYGKEFVYVTVGASGESFEERVKALVSEKTGDPFRRTSFQLLSAGPDGRFGGRDDIANFDYVPPEER